MARLSISDKQAKQPKPLLANLFEVVPRHLRNAKGRNY